MGVGMNLKDILALKTKAEGQVLPQVPTNLTDIEEIEDRNPINDFILTSEKEDNEKALTAFLILYYKAHAKDVFIRQGEGACLLYEFLGCPISSNKYNPLPLGHSIKDAYVIHNILGLPHYVVYGIMEKINLKFQKI